jgi:hypothetical protein
MSLTEVLVALFILALGVIGILAMFPLAASQMAQALRDDRSALAAQSADAYMRWYWRTYVVEAGQANAPLYPNTDPAFLPGTGLFDNPGQLGGSFAALPALTQMNAGQLVYMNSGLVSYPVIVDPIGIVGRNSGGPAGVSGGFGETPGTFIPRCTLSTQPLSVSPRIQMQQPLLIQPAPTQPGINTVPSQGHLNTYPLRVCSLTDGLGYNDNGTPSGDLELQYNWMWVLQRPQFVNEPAVINNARQQPNTNLLTANMTVVVFNRRSFGFPTWSQVGYEVVVPNVSMTSGTTSITITPGASLQAQDLKPGTWIMDATINPGTNPPQRNCFFYRVVSVTPISATQVNIEVQTPISPPTGNSPLGFTWNGTLVVLRGVSGVYIRPPLTPY